MDNALQRFYRFYNSLTINFFLEFQEIISIFDRILYGYFEKWKKNHLKFCPLSKNRPNFPCFGEQKKERNEIKRKDGIGSIEGSIREPSKSGWSDCMTFVYPLDDKP